MRDLIKASSARSATKGDKMMRQDNNNARKIGKERRSIGIIGGMGPEATALLFQRIIAATPARDDSEHIPLLIDNDSRIPSRIAHLIEGIGEDPAPYLCQMAQRLEAANCAALAMPCNTAHHYAQTIQASIGIPLLNMVQQTSAILGAMGVTRVGMFTSPALKKVGVYEKSFTAHGLNSIFPANDETTLNLIRGIKAGQKPNTKTMAIVLDELAQAGSEVILVGCSELSLYSDSLPTTLPCIDSIDVLRDSIIDFA